MMQDYSLLDPAKPLDAQDDVAQYEAVFGAEKARQRPFMNIGAGDWTHPLWRNLDCVQPPYDKYTPPDYNIDLSEMSPWPIANSELKLLFTSHTLEHLNNEVAMHVLRECYRVLAPGGILRVVVPDITTAYWAYRLKDRQYYDERSRSFWARDHIAVQSNLGHSRGETVTTCFFLRFASCFSRKATFDGKTIDEKTDEVFARSTLQEGCEEFLKRADMKKKKPNLHINWYTGEKLSEMLRDAGFDEAVRTSYGQSLSPLMRNKVYFDRTRPTESLYVDAIKF